jgi:pimeloyl-ACP methyl ester carboxylesterase
MVWSPCRVGACKFGHVDVASIAWLLVVALTLALTLLCAPQMGVDAFAVVATSNVRVQFPGPFQFHYARADRAHKVQVTKSTSHPPPAAATTRISIRSAPSCLAATVDNHIDNNIEFRTYEHDGWNCAYRYKKAEASQSPPLPPILLVHPVGIGLSSWFWEPFMKPWDGEVYALDLIGCGTLGGDYWDPAARGLFFPLSYVKQCEALIMTEIQRPCIVVCQGGIAPIGLSLAARDAERQPASAQLLSHLVLTSPPTYTEITTPIPPDILLKSLDFYRSWWGRLTFKLLENDIAIRLFSNLFLFANEIDADDEFVRRATQECQTSTQLRPPIEAFNAGLMQHRSYQEDMQAMTSVPTLILSGDADKRQKDRVGYTSANAIPQCTLQTLPGQNVVPWESPQDTVNAIRNFVRS